MDKYPGQVNNFVCFSHENCLVSTKRLSVAALVMMGTDTFNSHMALWSRYERRGHS